MHAVVPRQRRDDVTMARRDVAEPMRLTGDAFERRQRNTKPGDEIGGGEQFAVAQSEARIGAVQVDRLVPPEFLKLIAESP